ncbi:MAG: endonuclease/exonuclease/phosphatase family protein [Bacteroidales bacterium]|nr:endonuclease/exonuclease/phosphatase family protein [Bacteroidales bacterium]
MPYKILTTLFLIFFVLTMSGCGQEKHTQYQSACIGFYNVENLFDTIDDPNTKDEQFLPDGEYQWTSKKYEEKLQNIASAIKHIGEKTTKTAPVILGLSEIENLQVLEDLVKMPDLKNYHYGIAHFDSPDRRGVDVALIYQSKRFKLLDQKAYPLYVESNDYFRTRDQLLVSGVLDKTDTLHIIVNHWPSRIGGTKKSEYLRVAAAQLCRHICDSLIQADHTAKIIIMGDLNDNPTDASITKHLRATDHIDKVSEKDYLFNTTAPLFKSGIGSCAYRDIWNLFDQIIISNGLTEKTSLSYYFVKSFVFNDPQLTQKNGPYKGYPFRTFSSGKYMGGFSDHYPTYIILVKPTK